MLYAGSLVFTPPTHPVDLRNWSQWWQFMKGANWRHPYGPKSNINGLDNHPVVHVAYRDALAYATWAGKELPTEAEWEFAARGGLDGAEFAWGDEFTPGGKHMANTWQGEFPRRKSLRGRLRAHLAGDGVPAERLRRLRHDRQCLGMDRPTGIRQSTKPTRRRRAAFRKIRAAAARTASYDPRQPSIKIPRKVLKGGSHLCAPNYCRRYRPAARHAEPVDTSTSHVGFRCIIRNQQKGSAHEQEQRRGKVEATRRDTTVKVSSGAISCSAAARCWPRPLYWRQVVKMPRRRNNRLSLGRTASPISSSSWAMTSATGTSAPTTTA